MARNNNLGKFFDADKAPGKVAIIDISNWDKPVELTYAAFDAECDAVARGLLKMGLKRGDRVGILSLNRYELLAAFLGTMRAGMVSVPISFKLARETVEYIVQDAGLKAVFHDRDRADLARRRGGGQVPGRDARATRRRHSDQGRHDRGACGEDRP